MPLVFKTLKDNADTVEIAGVGTIGSNGRGGRAVVGAATAITELQNSAGEALTGRELKVAAEAFAERHRLEVLEVDDQTARDLPTEMGALPEPVPADQMAALHYQRFWQPETTDELPEGFDKLGSVKAGAEVAEPISQPASKDNLLEEAEVLGIEGASKLSKDNLRERVIEARKAARFGAAGGEQGTQS